MHIAELMTREVVTTEPDMSVKYAGGVLAERGFAALPVVDGAGRLMGVVAEVDVLRDRVPPDPRLHARSHDRLGSATPGRFVRDVMTSAVSTVPVTADVADVARLMVDGGLRSLPVLDGDRLVGIVSRRDILRWLTRSDGGIEEELLKLIEAYTGDLGCWDVEVTEGTARIARTHGAPQYSKAVEEFSLSRLAATVPGIIGARVLFAVAPTGAPLHNGASS